MATVKGRMRTGFSRIDLMAVMAAIATAMGLLIPFLFKTRERVFVCSETAYTLKQCALGVHGANDNYKYCPPFAGVHAQKSGSFFFHLLPFVENGFLYSSDVGINGAPQNKIVRWYLSHRDWTHVNNGEGTTNFAVNIRLWSPSHVPRTAAAQPDAAFKLRMPGSFPDGTSHTLLFATRFMVCGNTTTSWSAMSGNEQALFGMDPVVAFGDSAAKSADNAFGNGWQAAPMQAQCCPGRGMPQSFWSQGIYVAMCDASVHFFSAKMTNDVWGRLLTPSGGEAVNPDWSEWIIR